MPLIDPNAKTSWYAVFGMLLVCAFFLVASEWPWLASIPALLALVLALGFVGGVVADMLRGARNWILELKESFVVEAPADPSDVDDAVAAPTAPPKLDAPRVRAVCPRCDEPLNDARGAFDERACPRAHGALIDGHASERLLERARLDPQIVRELAREQGAERVRCASCNQMMRETRLRSIPIDLCLSCGAMWLDDTELEALSGDAAFREPPDATGGR